jgi:hypothetical protein
MQLERPVPALALEGGAGGGARRRPDAHHRGAERRIEQGVLVPRPVHEEGDGNGLAALGERRDRRAQLPRSDRVDAERRLVQEHDRRVVEEPTGDVQPLAHPPRIALDPLLLATGEADQVEQLVDPPPLLPRRDRVQLGEVAQVVVGREALVQPAVAAEDVADPPAHLARVPDDVEAEHARRSRGRDQQRDQHLDRRRLAGAVRSEQAEQLSGSISKLTPRTASTSIARRRKTPVVVWYVRFRSRASTTATR